MGCSPWGRKESDTTEQLSLTRLTLNRLLSFQYFFTGIFTSLTNSNTHFDEKKISLIMYKVKINKEKQTFCWK